jgi:ankyrin repeat protein
LDLFRQRGITFDLSPFDTLAAACARADRREIEAILKTHPDLSSQMMSEARSLVAEFAGNGNVEGLRCLLELGAPVDVRYGGDGYFDIAPESTALHVAAWRLQPKAVVLLMERGASVNVADAKGRTPLQLAVKACVDSYWMKRRTPDSVAALLNAGASSAGIELPTGYEEIDRLLQEKP